MITTFVKWLETKKPNFELSIDADTGKPTIDEKTKRTGLSFNYPDAYVRNQYPHKYFNPIKATTDLDLEQKPKTPPDDAP